MGPNYEVEKTVEGISLTRQNVEDRVIKYSVGLSAADPDNPEQVREIKAYLEKVLAPLMASGEIGDGKTSKFDDRKFRFHSASILPGGLELQLGITHFRECAGCREWDDEKRAKMLEEGQRRFSEPYAFFTRGCGVEVTPISAEGSIFVGEREVADAGSGYGGELTAVNGWVDYRERLEDVDFAEDALRELWEEYGIKENEVEKLIFLGVFSALNCADTDFVYIAQTKLPDMFFSAGEYKTRRKDKEHGELIKIANFADMQRLLETGELPGQKGKFDVLYSLEASLRQIRPDEMAA